MKPVRYSYGITAALLAGGAAISLATGQPAGAQVAQNDDRQIGTVVPRTGAPASFADLTEQLAPAVVNISTRQRITVNTNPFQGTPFEDFFGNRGGGGETTREAQSLGSGFLVSADGYVVTNNHVIQPPGANAELEEVTVTTTDGTEYPAEVVGRDPASDLAVLKISGDEAFPFVEFGDSSEARAGDWVVAIGNPFGLDGTVTSGIVSAVVRATGLGAYDRFIQTDASINRGNSGGPLFDMQGNVIGINNAIFSPSGGNVGIGFAIPAETAQPIVQKLIAGEEIVRGYLGVRIGPITEDFAEALGLPENRGEFIQSVVPGEPADQAGLRAGDVVVRVNGEDVTRDQTLSFLINNIEPGSRVNVEIVRAGERLTVPVTLGRRPSEEELAAQVFNPEADDPTFDEPDEGGLVQQALGIAVIPVTPQIARQIGMPESTSGVVIAGVDPNSDAARKGLGRGTVISSANYTDIATVADLEAVVRAARAEGRSAVLLRVQARGQQELSIPVRLRGS